MFWERSEDICYQESEILKCRWINKCDSANFMVEIRNWTTELGKHATSTLKDDEHYTHSAYLQGGYQKNCFISFSVFYSSLWQPCNARSNTVFGGICEKGLSFFLQGKVLTVYYLARKKLYSLFWPIWR